MAELSNNRLLRIERLEYGSADFSSTGTGVPPLLVHGTLFGPASDVRFHPRDPALPGEVVHWPARTIVANPAAFVRPRSVGLPGTGADIACRFAVTAVPGKASYEVAFKAYVTSTPLLTFPAACDGSAFIWVGIFVDSFMARSSRNHSTTGVYAVLNSFKLKDQLLQQNIHDLMLLKPGVDLGEVMASP